MGDGRLVAGHGLDAATRTFVNLDIPPSILSGSGRTAIERTGILRALVELNRRANDDGLAPSMQTL